MRPGRGLNRTRNLRPLRTSHSAAHGVEVIRPLDQMSIYQCYADFKIKCRSGRCSGCWISNGTSSSVIQVTDWKLGKVRELEIGDRKSEIQ